MSKKVRKIFVVDGQTNYANWMQGELVDSVEKADIVLFTGGQDINPNLYGQSAHPYTSYSDSRDKMEIRAMNLALSQNKLIWGTCRGAQLMCAYNGGSLVQHVQHPSMHNMIMDWNKKQYSVTSCHHQMLNVTGMNSAAVIGYAKQLSPIHQDSKKDIGVHMMKKYDDDCSFIAEPEIVFFNRMNQCMYQEHSTSTGLCVQGHPEWMDVSSPTITMLRGLLDMWCEDPASFIANLYVNEIANDVNPIRRGIFRPLANHVININNQADQARQPDPQIWADENVDAEEYEEELDDDGDDFDL